MKIMKKHIFILAALCAFAATSFAQEEEVISNKPTHYINLSPKVGYAIGFDNLSKMYIGGTGDVNVPYANSKSIGGWGAGLGVEYEFEYNHFLLNAGLDFDFLSAMSKYDFGFERPMTQPYDLTYRYRFFQYAESRNIATIGVPIRVGAQFGNFYFLVGAKVGYGLFGNFKGYGEYQVTAYDKTSKSEIQTNHDAGTGLFNIDKGANTQDDKLSLKPLDVRALAEIGLDLDKWLQAPVPKNKPKVQKGATHQPFTQNNIHYRVGLFAEYDILSVNNQAAGTPTFESGKTQVAGLPSVLAERSNGMPSLNNLFAGVKFTIQFAIPEKIRRQGGGKAVPPTLLDIYVLDKETKTPLEQSFMTIKNLKNDRMVKTGTEVRKGKTSQRFNKGEYEMYFSQNDYYPDTTYYEATTPNGHDTMTVYLQHRPVLRVRVSNAETGKKLSSVVKIRHSSLTKPIILRTAAKTGGENDTILNEVNGNYRVTIDKKGYEPYAIELQSLGETLDIKLVPIKVGRTFILKNMFFATNKTQILPESEEALQTLYEYLTDEQSKGHRIRIIGHTDNVGKDAANQKLSEGRANAVRNELINRGIDPTRIEAEGKGESQPIDTNDTEEGRANNRRVEVLVLE